MMKTTMNVRLKKTSLFEQVWAPALAGHTRGGGMSGGTLKSRGAVFSTTSAPSRFSGGLSLNVTSAGDEMSRDSDAVASVSRFRNEQECFFSGHAPLFAQQQLRVKVNELATG
jgi:hypothetical protein